MANFNLYFPILLGFEGGWSDDKNDAGGPTKYGITLEEWIREGYDEDGDGDIDKDDLKIITTDDAKKIAKAKYWDRMRGDEINSQTIAEFISDWAYNSGVTTATKKLQQALDIKADGVFGPQTLNAVNSANAETLFKFLKASREAFYRAIVEHNPTQAKFLQGWLNRNNSFKFKG